MTSAFNRQATPVINRHMWLCAALVVITALGVRVFALLSFQQSLYADFMLVDEQVYHQWAIRMISGQFGDLSVFDFAPFPAYIMAAIYALLSPDPFYIRILNMGLGVASCVIIFLIGRRLGGLRVGLASGLAAALYEPFIFFSVALHKTALSVFLFSSFVYAGLALMDALAAQAGTNGRPSGYRLTAAAFFAGTTMALLINVRSNAIVMLPVVLIFAAWAFCRDRTALRIRILAIGGIAAGFILAASPFMVRDYKLTGSPSPMPAGGFNLYIANNPDNPLPYYRPVSFATSTATEQGIGFVIEASRREGRKLTPREASAYWTAEVIRNAKEQPAAFFRKTALKALAALNRYESADNHHLGFLKDHISFLAWPFFTIGLLMPPGMAGLVLLGFTSRKNALAALLCLAYGATLVIFFSNLRIRLPVMVILIPFAVMWVFRLIDAVKKGSFKKVCIFSASAIFFFALAFLPVPGDKDFTAYLNAHAAALASRGRTDEAFAFWEKSAAMEMPYSAFANLSLVERYADQGDFEKSMAHIERVPDRSLAGAQKFETLGDLLLRQGRVHEAIEAYRRSIEINSGRREVRLKLFRAYWDMDRELAHSAYAGFEYVSSFYGAMQ